MGSAYDFLSSLLDEIALEGLDGISLKMLWQRLAERPDFPIAVDEDSISFFWNCVAKHKDIEIYALQEPRLFVPIFNRYDHIDSELGVVVESPENIPDPYSPVVSVKDGEVRGSCSTYKTRKCVTSEIRCGNDVLLMSLGQAEEKWGDHLVLVASPKLRLLALIGTETNPLIDLSLEAYCLLERIGRSRYHGEVTQGEGGLLALKASFCKQLHYYRKKLTLKGLITKQTHYMKTRKGNTSNGSLFHLTRFYVQRKTKMASIMKKLCDILKDKPKNREICKKLKEELGIRDSTFKKLFYRPFQKWVKVDTIPIHEMYPDASRKDCFTINGNEKVVKIVQLLRHCDDENDDEEEEEDMADEEKRALPLNMHFDFSKLRAFVPLVLQVYQLVEEAGSDGISSSDIGRVLTLPRLDIRTLLRILIKKGRIITILQDRGRQKVTKYISKKFADQNEAYSSLKDQDVITVKEPVPATGPVNEEKPLSKRKASDDEWEPEDTPPHKKKKPESKAKEPIAENGVTEEKTTPETAQAESNFQNIVSHVLEIQNKSHFTGKAPKLVSFSDQPVYPPPYAGTTQLTYRKLKRSNMIMDYLKTERFTTLSDLQKYIVEREKEEGYSFKLDKKSTARLVYSLYNSKKIKIFKAVLKLEKDQTEIEFICDKSLESSDPYIQVAIEQAKFKYFSVSKDGATKKPPPSETQPTVSKTKPTKSDASAKSGSEKSAKKTAHSDGLKYPSMTPKFRRTKALHLFLYYLVYEHKGDPVSSDEQRVYHDSMSWKRFIPPLPDYGKKGWCFLADIYTRMPLSLFVKVVNFRQGVPGLNQYLENEEKSNYLIKYLPQALRNSLLNNRKYLFSTNDVIKILCFMGLVSIGPQVGKQKDQVFLYIHRNASLKDTTISPPGYIYIQTNINYETKYFEFKTENDIENYWLELESVCFHTPLGKFSAAAGKTIAITEANYKPELVGTTKNKGFDEVTDVGTIPGDGLGAAGFDSVLFLHSRRNWQSSSGIKPQNVLKDKLQTVQVSNSIQDLLKSKEATKVDHKPQRLLRLTKSNLQLQKENKLKMLKENSTQKTATKAPSASLRSKKKTKVRTIKMRSSKKRSPYYDEKDRAAMEKLDKARCDWSNQEDSFLLLCKVASSFLEPYYNKNLVVPYTVVRDLLHEHVPGISANKSSRACQRRLRYMMVNPTTIKNVSVFLGEAQQDVDLVKEFDKPKPPKSNVAVWQSMFTSVLKKLQEKFTLPASNRCRNLELPSTIQEFQKRFEFVSECDLSNPKRIYNEPQNPDDIKKFVLNSLVLSAMAILNDGAQWSYLLHKLYQGYSEATLQSVVTHLRRERVIAVKKRSHRSDIQRSLRSTCPYKFSITYNNAMLTKVPIKIFRESRELLDSFKGLSMESGIELKGDVPPGYAAAVLSLVMMQQLSVHTKIPDQIILFDSSLSKEARTTIVERMINTLSDKESMELSQLLNNGSTTLVPPNTEDSERVHSTVVHEREIADADSMMTSDSAIQTSQLSDGQRFQNASRFALYLLRQELSQPPIERVQHSQDYIILNSCRVFCRLKPPCDGFILPVNPSDIIQKTHDKVIESEYIPPNMVDLNPQRVTEISDLLRSYIPPEAFSTRRNYLEALEELYKDYAPQTFLDGQNIFGYLFEKKEGGGTEKEVWQTFSKLPGELSLFEHLNLLREGDLILRVGVLAFTYVCSCFANNWVLKSFQIPGIFSKQDSISPKSVKENSTSENSISIVTDFVTTVSCSKESTDDLDLPISDQNSCLPSSKDDKVSNGILNSVHSAGLDSAKGSLQDDSMTTVHFVPRTWRNPDGSLNQPVFFSLLSTVLSHIISFPAVSSSQVCEQFLQVMPPVQTLELLEVLEKASCVYKYYCRPVKKCSLFSATSTFFITENPEPEDIDHLEPFPDAVIKIAKLKNGL